MRKVFRRGQFKMTMRMEHANMCVRDLDAMVKFLKTAFPEWRVRGEGKTMDGESTWMHIGDDDNYIALSPATRDGDKSWKPYCGAPGVNHLAYIVDDADEIEERMLAAGYKESTVANNHPHRKRVYFNDPEGNDWEFVQYFSDDPAERNDYDLPDK